MDPTSNKQGTQVEIRIRNAGEVDLDHIRVSFPDGLEVDYGSVPKGGLSAFHSAGRAYRYAGISAQAAGRALSLQPTDYLGETELPAGRYTYAVSVAGGQLTLELERA